jgi:hypothetical protein
VKVNVVVKKLTVKVNVVVKKLTVKVAAVVKKPTVKVAVAEPLNAIVPRVIDLFERYHQPYR